MTEPLLVSITDAARMLGLGRTKTYELINEGQLDAVSIGHRNLIKVESVRALVDNGHSNPMKR